MNKSKAAFLFSAERLAERGLYMWTFTFKEVLDIKDTRKRWNHLLTLIKRTWPDLCGLRVFELHENHGLHVHMITNRFVDVNACRKLALQSGWGRIHVQRIPSERAKYLAKYLGKDREPCMKRWRLWAGFGEWERTLVSNIELDSPRARIYRNMKEIFKWKGNRYFTERMQIVERIYESNLKHGFPAQE